MKVFGRTPLDYAEVKIPHGRIHLIPERCKGCEICIQLCPKEILQVSTKTNQKGYHFPEIVPGKGADCVHCQFCSMVCPEFAIFTLEGTE